ncbi:MULTISPECIES: HlyD family secretion protein [unclassified Bradyrhizobium]|jgi:multidrug resistance efflux pump|uniref:HlyD family secretion protein n=1 Tax=unclassified Bradyrhizobium TaxID=2631580 RepID=UPI002303CF7F|nr:biotin/lipoyl-binding protein [Bradyrhizobium sp. CCBAU 25338]MDA9531231.1 secretion protein HlyD [Bradyrhizobium sp. CCBAU 25338]
MLELAICSLLTILPDYLYRRFAQGKRFGKEITLFSVWYELRWGITGCLMLTVALITSVFFFHPATRNAALLFRTVPILPEGSGRVVEVNFGYSAAVKKGDVLFTLDSSKQKAALETATRKVAEIDASLETAKSDVVKAEAQLGEAKANYQQAKDELDVKIELQRRNPGIVPQRDIEKLQVIVDQRQAGIDAARATLQSAALRVSTLLPAEKASAQAARAEAQVDLDKTFVRAGVDGRVEQFLIRAGDVVNQLMRPAGILIPEGAGQAKLQAGFDQIESGIMREGMVAEATCISKPWVIVPLVVTSVQDYIAAGQFRSGEQLIEAQNLAKPGTILVFLEPLYKGGLDGVTAGSSCIVNAYTSNHDEIVDPKTSTGRKIALHVIDGIGFVHALLLRIQALLLPFKTLVFGGGHG